MAHPATKSGFEHEASAAGSLYVGSPETVAGKIARTVATLGVDRFDLKYSSGRLPHHLLMENIELYGPRVIPLAHEMLTDAGLARRAS